MLAHREIGNGHASSGQAHRSISHNRNGWVSINGTKEAVYCLLSSNVDPFMRSALNVHLAVSGCVSNDRERVVIRRLR